MKAAEIKEITTKEILERIEAEKDQLVKVKLNHAISPLDNPMQIRASRRNIARLLTILRQRELTENK
ncbi:MAG: 50S ribosomal protein L29 [Bacteroidota bacterium]|nr:50S ribosomal protein L29 [Bacteroidota bacterium]MDP4204409.1 50S ribosomal protein L29 [Bacteroidota bacterium]